MLASSFFIFLQKTEDCFCFIILNCIFVLNYNKSLLLNIVNLNYNEYLSTTLSHILTLLLLSGFNL